MPHSHSNVKLPQLTVTSERSGLWRFVRVIVVCVCRVTRARRYHVAMLPDGRFKMADVPVEGKQKACYGEIMRRRDYNADDSLLGLLLFGRDEQQRIEHERLLDFFVNRTKIATFK